MRAPIFGQGVRRRYGLPTDISAVVAWWSADDHGTANMTDDGDGLISSWIDSIGGLELTAATTARPTWAATSFNNGYAGLTFDGSANTLRGTTLTGLPASNTPGEILLAGSSTVSGKISVCYGGVTVETLRQVLRSGNTLLASDGTNSTFPPRRLRDFWVGGGTFGATTIDVSLDGVIGPQATGTTLNTGTTRFAIGSNNAATAANFLTGVVRHVIITNALTLAERQKLEGYLAGNSGLQHLLPFNHPYKYGVP